MSWLQGVTASPQSSVEAVPVSVRIEGQPSTPAHDASPHEMQMKPAPANGQHAGAPPPPSPPPEDLGDSEAAFAAIAASSIVAAAVKAEPEPERVARVSATPKAVHLRDDLTVEGEGSPSTSTLQNGAAGRQTPTAFAIGQYAQASVLCTAMIDAEAAVVAAWQHVNATEDEWSVAEGQLMQTNSQLRMESRQAERRAKAAEKALAAAQQRIGELEVALEEAALRSDESQLDDQVGREAPKGASNVASLGVGHGGIDLGGGGRSAGTSHSAHYSGAPRDLPSPTDSTHVHASPSEPGGELRHRFISPPKLTLEETVESGAEAEAEQPAKRAKGGCCIVS
mmetsp:Transcript_5670/g.15051  ORF Transcript_5670/g.15051 Transcript_5670/m.15051 type:complete len:339 (+) Transcript_5670:32-1048(+)